MSKLTVNQIEYWWIKSGALSSDPVVEKIYEAAKAWVELGEPGLVCPHCGKECTGPLKTENESLKERVDELYRHLMNEGG